jgi:hypothetical protein
LLAGRCGDRGGLAERSKHCCGSQSFGDISGGCQERGCGDDADATEREQDRVENPDKEVEVALDDRNLIAKGTAGGFVDSVITKCRDDQLNPPWDPRSK